MNRLVATLPESVDELCLIRLGLMVLKPSGWPFLFKMGRAIKASTNQPEAVSGGLLHSERMFVSLRHVVILQYWASFDQMEAWSHAEPHAEWWRGANARMRTKGDFAIYHESYVVPRAGIESIYLNSPKVGLAVFGITSAAEGKMTTSRDRLGRRVAQSNKPKS